MKFLLGIALALGIAATAYAAAAALIVDGGVVQYGSDVNLTCTPSVVASATTVGALDPTIDFISVDGLANCSAQKIRIGLTGSPGGPAEWYNGLISGGFDCDGAGPLTGLCFNHNVSPASTWTAPNLTDIHITLYSY